LPATAIDGRGLGLPTPQGDDEPSESFVGQLHASTVSALPAPPSSARGALDGLAVADLAEAGLAETGLAETGLADLAAAGVAAAGVAAADFADRDVDAEPIPWDQGLDSDSLCPPDCPGCDFCAPAVLEHHAPKIYVRGEYLMWWGAGVDVPPLATSSATSTPANDAGVLDRPSTSVLFGGQSLTNQLQSGGRFQLGTWLDPSSESGVELTFLFLGEERDQFAGSDANLDILARPYFDADAGMNRSDLIVFPGEFAGALSVATSTEMQSVTLDYRRMWRRGGSFRRDLLVGYRFANLDDRLSIRETREDLSGADAGDRRERSDRWTSSNAFHGGELGVELSKAIAPGWSVDALARVALGVTQSRGRVSGETTTTTGGGSVGTAGGLLTQATNLGRYQDDRFGALSEFGVNLQRRIGARGTLGVGYTFLLWSDVWRAGEQLDLSVNPTQIPPGALVGPAVPAFPGQTSRYWAQGLQLRLETNF
jgi:hypothetical protein